MLPWRARAEGGGAVSSAQASERAIAVTGDGRKAARKKNRSRGCNGVSWGRWHVDDGWGRDNESSRRQRRSAVDSWRAWRAG